ncbi:MAG TPA: hypothetical protein VJ888_06305 [Mobilitalea sp.]|nr:hypothetical protein [Mobilitalea sp.]
MKDMVNQRIIQLGAAQECMGHVSDIVEKLEQSQLRIEKSSYEAMNSTDKVLNLSREGLELMTKLKSCYQTYITKPSEVESKSMTSLLEDMCILIGKITENATKDNEILHTIEREVANQSDATEEISSSIGMVSDSINQAAACAEIIMTMDF